MKPTFQTGDWLVVVYVPQENLKRGDIIVFQNIKKNNSSESDLAEAPSSGDYGDEISIEFKKDELRFCVHRIIAVRPEGLITRGDNNIAFDEGLLPLKRVIGRVAALERRGRIIRVHGGT